MERGREGRRKKMKMGRERVKPVVKCVSYRNVRGALYSSWRHSTCTYAININACVSSAWLLSD